MSPLATFFGFLSVSLLIALSPGPSWVYTISTTLSNGRRAGMVANLGNSCGILCHALTTSCGLALLLQYSTAAFQLLKFLGVGYLVYLALRNFCGRSLLETGSGAKHKSLGGIFSGGVFASLFNPKILLLMVALLPQFVVPGRGAAELQLVLLGAGHALVAGLVHTALIFCSAAIASRLKGSGRIQTGLRWATGGLFLSFGIRLALARQG